MADIHHMWSFLCQGKRLCSPEAPEALGLLVGVGFCCFPCFSFAFDFQDLSLIQTLCVCTISRCWGLKRKINYEDVVGEMIRVGRAVIASKHLHFPDVTRSVLCCSFWVQTGMGDKVCVAHVIACMCVYKTLNVIRARLSLIHI